MNYRTRINGNQIFGNNEWYPEWIEFVKSQGIEVDEDNCYEGEITDVKGLFITIDKITRRLIKEQDKRVAKKETWDGEPVRKLTDFSEHWLLDDYTPLLAFGKNVVEHAYIFLPYQVYKIVEDSIQSCDTYKDTSDVVWSFNSYELKPGCHIYISAS